MEQQFIKWLEANRVITSPHQSVLLGVGDDGAILRGDRSNQVMVADAIVQDVHFVLGEHSLANIGRKAMSVNLSDIAAMGAVAESALVSLVLPRNLSLSDVQDLFSGIASRAEQFEVAIVGGDTTRHEGPLMISVSMSGRIPTDSQCPAGWRMDGAKQNDLLLVTGELGGSILGRHLLFQPRLDVAAAIQQRVPVNAATDISDSLTVDLAHVLRKSGVAAVLDCDQIPISDAAKQLSAKSGKSPLHHALYDGEDFELLLSIAAADHDALLADPSFELPLTVIGKVSGTDGKIIDGETGKAIAVQGYEHG